MQEEIVSPLLGWYQENKRELPWRKDRNPYFIWVSEIMLQQTRVEAVKPYFRRFIQELPDVPALAACPEERLLKLWEGLGYYNRVRNMQKAAVTVTERYGGILPADDRALRELPGIGSYTAGAIASIAYGIRCRQWTETCCGFFPGSRRTDGICRSSRSAEASRRNC